MASFRYLEFDSTYRDRNMYPNPAEFVVELSSSGKNGRETARDPVSNASPELYWNSSFNELTNEQYISRIIISDINGSGNCVLEISNTVLFPPNFSFRTNKNYYTGKDRFDYDGETQRLLRALMRPPIYLSSSSTSKSSSSYH